MTRQPKFDVPPGACDSHIHVYGDKSRFPSMPVNGREMEDHYLDDYIAVRDALGLSRTVIIQTPHYGNDNASMLDSLAALGLYKARGIAVTAPDISDAELESLHAGGVRGVGARHAPGTSRNLRGAGRAVRLACPISLNRRRFAGARRSDGAVPGRQRGRSYWQHPTGTRPRPPVLHRLEGIDRSREILGETFRGLSIVENRSAQLFRLSDNGARPGGNGFRTHAMGHELAASEGRFHAG